MMENVKQEREIKRGDVYWYNMTGKGSQQQGLRPVMVISNNQCNKFSPVINVAPLSTQLHKKRLPTHITLLKEDYNELPKDSFLMLEQITLILKSDLGGFVTNIEITDEMNYAVEIALGITSVESGYVKRIKENIKIKVEAINVLDIVIAHHLDKGRSIEIIQDDMLDRKLRIRELEAYCLENNQIMDDYYDINCINRSKENIRLVG